MVAFQAKFNAKIADLNHRIALCRMHDIVDENGEMQLRREGVRYLWAAIRPSPTVMSFLAPTGYPFEEFEDRQTHRIIIRMQTEVDISSAAWVYEERLKSPPRWYKILGFFEQLPCWLILTAHLHERSDKASPPTGTLTPQPSKVRL